MGRRVGVAHAPSRPAVLLPEGRGFLTRRQVEILRLMANGYSGRETGRLLGIGSETVKFHKRSIYNELGADNGPHAVASALRRGIIE
jgi:two-component system, NarL family, nitrate/nitrite response regulator NarL